MPLLCIWAIFAAFGFNSLSFPLIAFRDAFSVGFFVRLSEHYKSMRVILIKNYQPGGVWGQGQTHSKALMRQLCPLPLFKEKFSILNPFFFFSTQSFNRQRDSPPSSFPRSQFQQTEKSSPHPVFFDTRIQSRFRHEHCFSYTERNPLSRFNDTRVQSRFRHKKIFHIPTHEKFEQIRDDTRFVSADVYNKS